MIVRYHNHAPLRCVRQLLQYPDDVSPVTAVQVPRRYKLASRYQRPPLLPARKHVGIPPELLLRQSHRQQLIPSHGVFLLPGGVVHVQRVRRVFQRRQIWEQVVVLLDHRHMLQPVIVTVQIAGGRAVKGHAPLRGYIQPLQQKQ